MVELNDFIEDFFKKAELEGRVTKISPEESARGYSSAPEGALFGQQQF